MIFFFLWSLWIAKVCSLKNIKTNSIKQKSLNSIRIHVCWWRDEIFLSIWEEAVKEEGKTLDFSLAWNQIWLQVSALVGLYPAFCISQMPSALLLLTLYAQRSRLFVFVMTHRAGILFFPLHTSVYIQPDSISSTVESGVACSGVWDSPSISAVKAPQAGDVQKWWCFRLLCYGEVRRRRRACISFKCTQKGVNQECPGGLRHLQPAFLFSQTFNQFKRIDVFLFSVTMSTATTLWSSHSSSFPPAFVGGMRGGIGMASADSGAFVLFSHSSSSSFQFQNESDL